MSNTLKRTYLGSDARMLEASEEIHELFLGDIADFTAFDTELDSAFATAWLSKIDTALGFKSDDTVVSEQKGKTSSVEDAMTEAKDAFHDILYFAEKAFKTDKDVLNEFGKGDKFHRAAKSQAVFVTFLEKFIGIVDTHKTALLNKGCPQATIDNVTTKTEALRTFNKVQNVAIVLRPETTKARVVDLNNACAPMTLVINAAQRIYKNNQVKRDEYGYNPDVSHFPPSVIYKGTLQPGEQRNIISSGIDQTKTIIAVNTSAKTTKAKIKIDLADNPNFIGPDAIELTAQQRVTVQPDQIPPLTSYFLNIKNLSTTKKAGYRIRVRDAG